MSIARPPRASESRKCGIIIEGEADDVVKSYRGNEDSVRPGLSEAGYNVATSVIHVVRLEVERAEFGTSGDADPDQFCKFGEFGNFVQKRSPPVRARSINRIE